MILRTVTRIVLIGTLCTLVGCKPLENSHPSLPSDQKAQEILRLIDSLKDFEWHSYISPSSDDDFLRDLKEVELPENLPEKFKRLYDRGLRRNTAEQLYDYGFEAAPYLIERITDDTPTRCMADFHGVDLGFLSIGHVCEVILGKLLGTPDQQVVPTDPDEKVEFLRDYFDDRLRSAKQRTKE
ncbi:MAG: hypothetical protein KDB03_26675 [Planctomycetales bacterium]|nr:hypothetical protein [Planctomycetales bacterium]